MVVWDVTPSDAKARSQTPFFEEKSEELSNKKNFSFFQRFWNLRVEDGGNNKEETDMRYQCRRQLFRGRPKNATCKGPF